ncbi:MAG TPA: hypothetical protein VFS81_19595 [Candidatus Binatia bacterium]|nr:hypothetical protein [Candidatus Binatia bacterium]
MKRFKTVRRYTSPDANPSCGPGCGSWWENLVAARAIALAQPNINRPDIFFQMTARLVA